MKRRRILALLLALSLAVSMNGMTVLAAGTGAAEGAEVSLDELSADGTQEASGDDAAEGAGQPGDTTGTEQTKSDSQPQDDSEGKADNDTESDVNPDDESGSEDGSETDDTTGEDFLGNDEADEVTEEEDSGTEELSAEEETEDPEADSADQETEEESGTATQSAVVRMVTFTDDTGMRITYDTNAAAAYIYTVSNGELTEVKNSDGTPVSGNVVLSQPDAGDTYGPFTRIGSSVFANNTEITYVKIPSGVTSISDGAFKNCSKLKGLYIPSKVESIGASAFEGCSSLTQLALPKSIQSIGARAFYGDARLFMVHMKDVDYAVLQTIGESAFEGCSSLEKFCSDVTFDFPESITTVGERAFYGCSKIPKVIMGNNVTSIGSYAFANCYSMSELSLSYSLELIPAYAFDNCTALQTVTMGNNSSAPFTEIAGYAFHNCKMLGSIELPDQVNVVRANAFEGCSALKRIYVKNGRATLEENAFPNGNPGICIMGSSESTASDYAADNILRFVAVDDSDTVEYYTYTSKLSGAGTDAAKPVTIKVTNTTNSSAADINTLNGGKGVTAGTKLYIYILFNGNSDIQLVPGSLKVNGTAITAASGGYYTYKMPIGGAVVSAEFAYTNSSVRINGTAENVSTALSNGRQLKVGQTTRLFLTSDHPQDENLIPTSKITYSVSPTASKSVASVASDGTIKALAVGSTVILAKVKDSDGQDITKTVTITVTSADVESIKVKAANYDSTVVTISENANGVQNASIDSLRVTKAYTFQLKATVYDADDDSMATALKWTSSDTKVAKLSAASTTAASSVNTVTIPAYTDGEATITVTATNADKTTVTEKFTISVKDYTPRLSASSITINPNLEEGTAIEVISAYGKGIDLTSVEMYDQKENLDYKDFELEYDEEDSTETISKFIVTTRDNLPNGTYNRRLKVKVVNTIYTIPLKIVVKKSVPSPKVAYVKNQPKLDLFRKNDGTEFNVTVSNLGNAKVADYILKPLTTSDDDKLFTDNFKVEYVDGSSCRITQQSEELLYTSKKKPAVTGYLVLTFEGYKSTITKEFKITIPTQTVTPSYALSRTSDTYYAGCAGQTIELQLLNKKNKNAVVDLNDGFEVKVKAVEGATRAVTEASVNDDGNIEMVMTGNPAAGKVYLEVSNDEWVKGKTFTYTYTIKTSTATPKISLTSATITMNPSYPEQSAGFGLKSNQTDTVISEEQTFYANVNAKTKASLLAEYNKLTVTYENGEGTVKITDPTIANGTYTFICDAAKYVYRESNQNANKLTLKVKVARAVPTVTAKGTLAFNTLAEQKKEDGSYTYVEKAELVFTKKNLPADGSYTYDEQKMLESITCNTKGYTGYEERFSWEIDEDNDKLIVSLKEWCPNRTYSFSITPTFTNGSGNQVSAKKINFNVKVYTGTIKVSLSAKGKLNLLDRTGEPTTTNSIVYTPKFTNLKDRVVEAKVYDAGGAQPIYGTTQESELFVVTVSENGLLYVMPKNGAELENNKTYKIMIWMKLADYTAFADYDGNGTWSGVLSVKTAQTLPKVTLDKSSVNLYLSNKDYVAAFVVDKQEVKAVKPAGKLLSIAFDEKDTKSAESFEINSISLPDGSLLVMLKLKDTVSYGNNTTNKIKMYVEFEGQDTNTAGTAITMSVKINK